MSSDKAIGMVFGHGLGDALGAPHEFRYQKKNYTGKLEHPTIFKTQWQPAIFFPPGTVTDDTQMSMSLLGSIYKNNGDYVREDVIKSYIEWANSGVKMIGINTRKLFKGIKTVKGYEKRHSKLSMEEISQSNGSLMRAYPLALVEDDDVVKIDCSLSNPNPINEDCNMLYIKILKNILIGKSKKYNIKLLQDFKGDVSITSAISQAINKEPRNINGSGKGWVLHAFLYFYIWVPAF